MIHHVVLPVNPFLSTYTSATMVQRSKHVKAEKRNSGEATPVMH
jgi:hypothetical protein